jgi:hypothetical protein
MLIKNGKLDTVVLHVGLHKTGTSSIQKTLFERVNNKLLEEKDYVYPKSWHQNHSVPIYSAFCDNPENYHVNIKRRYSISKIKDINKQNLVKLETEIAKREKSKLIVSGEDISHLSYGNLNDLKDYIMSISTNNVTIKVIIYVRNPISWSISTVQEQIKGGKTYQDSLIHIRNNLKNYFRNKIDKFVQVFGKEYIDVYSFEEAVVHEYGPVGHFLSMLGFNNSEISRFDIIRANESISLLAGDMLSFINEKAPMIKDGKIHEKRIYGDIVPFLGIKGPKFDVPYDFKEKLFKECQDDIKRLKDKYGIDYSSIPVKSQINYNFTKQTIRDIKKVYSNPQLSKHLRELVIEYLQKQLKNSTNPKSKLLLKQLLKELSLRNKSSY